jgi:hypothetical protein
MVSNLFLKRRVKMYSWQNIDYGKAGELAHGRDPRKFIWGYFASDTLPESGVGLFFWFESPAELLAFIMDIETLAISDKKKVKKVQDLIKRINFENKLTEELRKQINNILGDIEIKWWGRFSDLCSGKSKFSKSVLNSYYGSSKYDKTKTVYLPKFVEFCEEFVQ